MKNKKALVITFIDPYERSGATNRLESITKRYSDLYDVDVLHIFSNKKKRFQQLWSGRNKISEISENYKITRLLKSFFRSFSFLSNRVAVLDDSVFNHYKYIICHTSRSFLALSPQMRKKVIHIDVCDNLVKGYRRTSFYFFLANPFLAFAYFYESVLEYCILRSVNEGVSISYITNNDIPTWLGNRNNVICFPNFYNFESISNELSHFDSDSVRIGLVGNFRTILNNQILKSLLKYKFPFKHEICLFGQIPEKKEFPSDLNIYGEYEDLLSIKNLFDIGYCCSPLQAGIQNKVIDYLFLNKPILIDEAVYASFANDEYYKILMESPLVLRNISSLLGFNSNKKNNDELHVACLNKFVKMNESYLKNKLHRVNTAC